MGSFEEKPIRYVWGGRVEARLIVFVLGELRLIRNRQRP